MANLAALLIPKTATQVKQRVINGIQLEGGANAAVSAINDWVNGGVVETLIQNDADVLTDLYANVPVIARSGFLETSEGEWTDVNAEDQYQLSRLPSLFARYQLTLTAQAGSGPYTIQPNQLWATTASGLRYNNTNGGTIPAGGSLILTFVAENPGAAYNVATGQINALVTPLSGVTVTNTGSALLSAGRDVETDDSLRSRCRLQWAELGTGSSRDAYESWARKGSQAVSRVLIRDQHPRGQGTVDVVVWGEGGIGTADVAAVNSYVQARKPGVSDVAVTAAVAQTVTVTATVYVRAANLAAAQAAVALNFVALAKNTPIEGTIYTDAINAAIQNAPGVRNNDLSAPAADFNLNASSAAQYVPNLTWVTI
jgi:uncharacterized phage protein gp47/JayE